MQKKETAAATGMKIKLISVEVMGDRIAKSV
jgi:hypothetical protein